MTPDDESTTTVAGDRVVAVLTTCGSRDEAERIARALVARRQAACAQLSAIDSVYRWDGAVHCDPEWRMLVKTTAARVPAVERTVRELHGYALPVVVSLPFEHVPPDVAAWVRDACGGASPAEGGPVDVAPGGLL